MASTVRPHVLLLCQETTDVAAAVDVVVAAVVAVDVAVVVAVAGLEQDAVEVNAGVDDAVTVPYGASNVAAAAAVAVAVAAAVAVADAN
eukprot:gene10074-biopygen1775